MKLESVKRIKNILSDLSNIPVSHIGDETYLAGELKLAPMDFGELCLRINNVFDVSFMSKANLIFMEECTVKELCSRIDKSKLSRGF